ncbi:hypothetical protein CDAR_253721 [Caerostris darwini]|uniref:Uncharacterized protein n=1 Tax=Caerostris darwini TaxID=1538125 RepID=A0AAV4Q4I7_9ARAC|nr:hypothetical protein CDAR_253721 [Caerostris darwini]
MSDVFPSEKCEELLPECKCSELTLNNVGLTCQNVSDFEAFAHILSNGSEFEMNSIYHIALSGNTVLPKGFLSGVIVSEFHLIDFQTEVEVGAFDGVLELNYLYIRRSSIKVSGFYIAYSVASDRTSKLIAFLMLQLNEVFKSVTKIANCNFDLRLIPLLFHII